MHAKHPFCQTGGIPKTTLSLYCKTAGFAKMARFTSRCRRAVKDKLQFPRFVAPPRSGTRQRTRAVLLWHPLARCWYPSLHLGARAVVILNCSLEFGVVLGSCSDAEELTSQDEITPNVWIARFDEKLRVPEHQRANGADCAARATSRASAAASSAASRRRASALLHSSGPAKRAALQAALCNPSLEPQV